MGSIAGGQCSFFAVRVCIFLYWQEIGHFWRNLKWFHHFENSLPVMAMAQQGSLRAFLAVPAAVFAGGR